MEPFETSRFSVTDLARQAYARGIEPPFSADTFDRGVELTNPATVLCNAGPVEVSVA